MHSRSGPAPSLFDFCNARGPTDPAKSYGGRGSHNPAFRDSQGRWDKAPRAVIDEPILDAGFVPAGGFGRGVARSGPRRRPTSRRPQPPAPSTFLSYKGTSEPCPAFPARGISSVPFDSQGGIILLGTGQPLPGQTRPQLSAQPRSIVGVHQGPPPLPWPFVARYPPDRSRGATTARAPPVPRAPGRTVAALTHREEWAGLARYPHGRPAAPAFVCLLCLPRALAVEAARPLGSRPGTPSAAGEGAPAGSARGPARPGAAPSAGGRRARSPPLLPALSPRSRPLSSLPLRPLPSRPTQPGHILCRPRTSRRRLRSAARPSTALGPRGRTVPNPWAPAPSAGQVRHGLCPPLAPPSRLPHLAARPDKGGLPGALRGGARGGLRLEAPLQPPSPPTFRRTVTFPRSQTLPRTCPCRPLWVPAFTHSPPWPQPSLR
ncbi:PREDICTED: basic proline-rich protein-like [Chrysochloris asiatica]|uniref:Basic proline-rich protein-like n=1 Tax=Chrysochloris asiatica TaxID=185453 RepID=A0A9B0TTN6_CHRAS|nr:PREDICTED: basic proline-rich protein-like [Chrysochloris asiatica]